ncbi:MAG: trigger factor [Patescibacteria group bacterium]
MKTTTKSISKTREQITASFDKNEVDTLFDRAVVRLSASVKIAGFRPGKAPKNVIKDNLDPQALREEAYSLAVKDAWEEIVKELKVIPIQDPEVDILEFEEGKPGKIVFEFDIRPEIKVGKWENIKVKDVTSQKVDDKEVDDVLKSLSKGHAKRVITLEPAKTGNQLDIEFSGSVGGVTKDKLASKHFPVILGESKLVPGFEQHLAGLNRGDEKSFKVTFPKDYFDKEMASQDVQFKVKVEEVYTIEQPELDDKFAEKFGHKKLEQLKKAIREDLENRNQEDFDNKRKAKWLAGFEPLVSVEVPKSLLEAEMSRSEQGWRQYLNQHNIKDEDWLARQNLTLEKLRQDWAKAAESSVKIGLGLSQLAHEQGRDLKDNDDFQSYLDELIEKTTRK